LRLPKANSLVLSPLQQKILASKSELLAQALEMIDLHALLAIRHYEPNGKQSFLKRALLRQLQPQSRNELLQAGDLMQPFVVYLFF
jgi:hypothetical protein